MDDVNMDLSKSKTYKYCKFVAKYPIISFSISVSIHLSALLTTAVLILYGYDVFPMDFKGLAMVLRNDETNTKALAFRARHHYPNKYTRITKKGPLGDWDRGTIADSFEVILQTDGQHIFSMDMLRKMKEIEDLVLSLKGYTSVCLLQLSGQCHQPLSVIRNMETAIAERGFPNTMNSTVINRMIGEVICDAYRDKKTSSKLKIFLENGYDPCNANSTAQMTRMFFQFGFGKNESRIYKTSKCTRSIFQNNVLKPAMDTVRQNFSRDGIDLHYFSHDIFLTEAGDQAMKDACLGVGGFFFIFTIMWFQTQSFWITFMGLYSIITSFLIANLVYRFCFGFTYFGYFHVVAIFIIIGIGADDVFVFYDSWRLTESKSYPDLAYRLTDFYRNASRTTFVTSLTTTLVFIVTSFSPLLCVKTFGLFSALLVSINYLFDLIYFPTAITIYTLKIKPFTKRVYKIFKKFLSYIFYGSIESRNDFTKSRHMAHSISTPRSRKKGILVNFFSKHFHDFITNRYTSVGILVSFLATSVFFIFFATKLEISTGTVELFKESNFFGKAYDLHRKGFQRLLDTDYTDVYILWGMYPQDTSSCNLKSSDFCHGSAVWDMHFNPSSAEAQISLKNMCNQLRSMSPEESKLLMIRQSEDGTDLDIDCFTVPMLKFLKNQSADPLDIPLDERTMTSLISNNTDAPQEFSNESLGWLEVGVEYWLSTTFMDNNKEDAIKYNNLLGSRIVSNQESNISGSNESHLFSTELQYIAVRIGTFMTIHNLSFIEGNVIYDKYEALISNINENMPMTMINGFQLTDYTWHWMRIQETLLTYGLEGLAISLGIALPVLVVSSMNIYIGLIATLVIGLVITSAIGLLPLTGHGLGVIESINLYMVVGLSVDYVVHFAEAYRFSSYPDRKRRVGSMLENMGLSVTSGALTTFGAASFMLWADIRLISQFGLFVMTIISLSYIYSLFGFSAVMALFGPEGDTGNLCVKGRNFGRLIFSTKKDAKDNGMNKERQEKEVTQNLSSIAVLEKRKITNNDKNGDILITA